MSTTKMLSSSPFNSISSLEPPKIVGTHSKQQ
jgi:hypothetical protein